VADIRVERKPRSPVPVLVGVLLLAVLGFIIWRYISTHRVVSDTTPVTAPAAPATSP
jgi:hypothetical protein